MREARTRNVVSKYYEAIVLGTLAVDRQSSTLAGLGTAKRWAAAEWRGRTLALR